MKHFLLIIFFLLLTFICRAQAKGYFAWPLDSPLILTGNYGELRPNHFHAGIDFSTSGKEDLPVYAAADGYVSRIRVSAVGYGKCLYITHPNGKVTVYAHLNSFSLKFDKVARAHQRQQKKYEIDYYPPAHTLHVKKRDIVALSGNTGGSTGPHLHFEVRDEKKETPHNALNYFKFQDKIPPTLTHISLFDLSDTTSPSFLINCPLRKGAPDKPNLLKDKIITERSIIGLAFSGFDRYRAGGNQNNIYSVRIYVDDQLIYHHLLKDIDFAESRYVNEYSERIRGANYQKCFLPTLYPKEMYEKALNKGVIHLSDQKFQTIKLVLHDESGNETSLSFMIRANKITSHKPPRKAGGDEINCAKNESVKKSTVKMTIPAYTFYRSTYVSLIDEMESKGRFTFTSLERNMNGAVGFSFKLPERYRSYNDKMVLRGPAGVSIPERKGDSLYFSAKNAGTFTLAIDTIAPVLRTRLAPSQIKDAWKMNSFSFVMSDNLSGVGKYELYLNNVWVLAEYDAKTQALTYNFDEDTPIGLLQFRLDVEDRVGNRETLFYLLKK